MKTAEMRTLLRDHPGWHSLMFMPTYRASRETRRDPLCFKNPFLSGDT